MDMKLLQESMQGFQPSDYGRVARNGEAYVATEQFVRQEVQDAVTRYRMKEVLDQEARLLRDKIDRNLRRYHEYAIKERLGKPGAHYKDASIRPGETKKLVFEHVIPLRYMTNALIQNKITIDHALNSPTCIIRKEQDNVLQKMGLGDYHPDPWNMWIRYEALGLQIITHDGNVVDQASWDLAQHIRYFNLG